MDLRAWNSVTDVSVTSAGINAAEVDRFAASCSDDREIHGVLERKLRSSWDHRANIMKTRRVATLNHRPKKRLTIIVNSSFFCAAAHQYVFPQVNWEVDHGKTDMRRSA